MEEATCKRNREARIQAPDLHRRKRSARSWSREPISDKLSVNFRQDRDVPSRIYCLSVTSRDLHRLPRDIRPVHMDQHDSGMGLATRVSADQVALNVQRGRVA